MATRSDLDAAAQNIHFLVDVLLYEGMTVANRKRVLGGDCPPIDVEALLTAFRRVEAELMSQVTFPLPPRDG